MQTRQTKNYAVLKMTIKQYWGNKTDENTGKMRTTNRIDYPTRVIATGLNRKECIDRIRLGQRTDEKWFDMYIMATEVKDGFILGDPIAKGFDVWNYHSNYKTNMYFAYDPPNYEPPCWVEERKRKIMKRGVLEAWIRYENELGEVWDDWDGMGGTHNDYKTIFMHKDNAYNGNAPIIYPDEDYEVVVQKLKEVVV